MNRIRTLRAVALFEAGKGVLALIGAVGLLAWLHHLTASAGGASAALDGALSARPAGIATLVFATVGRSSPVRFAAVASAYAGVRFVEAYGLWRRRGWAEWIAMLGGAAYLPFELWHMVVRFSWPMLAVTAVNLLVVIIVALAHARRAERCRRPGETHRHATVGSSACIRKQSGGGEEPPYPDESSHPIQYHETRTSHH